MSCAFLALSQIGLLLLYLSHFQAALVFDCYIVIMGTLSFSFFRLLGQYLAHQRLFFQSITTQVSQTLLGFSFLPIVTLVPHALLEFHFVDYYVNTSHTLRILLRWIVTLVIRAPQEFSFIGLLSQYLLLHRTVTLVSSSL